MGDRRLSDDCTSLVFKYCDEIADFTAKQLAKLIEKLKFTVYDVLVRNISRSHFQQQK